ncbi:hypothetical protein BpHYR1_014618 [Brachionus plicatilis]|uniref:Uncharacterized protein n=1 Tax=Brachionus plicatilis TaxID=10195 RepID=A0A3M7QIQ6_BRAPC|nr:hypothetical protein BpHYR1_014618 [Brachionus plicatilis]
MLASIPCFRIYIPFHHPKGSKTGLLQFSNTFWCQILLPNASLPNFTSFGVGFGPLHIGSASHSFSPSFPTHLLVLKTNTRGQFRAAIALFSTPFWENFEKSYIEYLLEFEIWHGRVSPGLQAFALSSIFSIFKYLWIVSKLFSISALAVVQNSTKLSTAFCNNILNLLFNLLDLIGYAVKTHAAFEFNNFKLSIISAAVMLSSGSDSSQFGVVVS